MKKKKLTKTTKKRLKAYKKALKRQKKFAVVKKPKKKRGKIPKETKKRLKSYQEELKKRKKWEKFQKPTFQLWDFLKWKNYDIRQSLKNRNKPHYYGIHMYCGLYGQGKTMSVVEYLERVRKKHGENVLIATNFFYKGQDFELSSWKQMLEKYEKTIIFAIDEVQNEFNTRNYRNFPYPLITLLTQNRKGNGVQLVTTAQRYDHVDKIFRDLTNNVFECKTILGRWTFTRNYTHDNYQMYKNAVSVTKKEKIPKIKYSFVQTNKLREQYDTLRMIDETSRKLIDEEEEEEKKDKKEKKEKKENKEKKVAGLQEEESEDWF